MNRRRLNPRLRLQALAFFMLLGLGSLAVFNSLALMDARYVSGAFEGKTVEYAPPVIERAGIRWARASLSSTAQVSYTARSFGDANNSLVASADAVTGPIPSYTVVDWSGAWRLGRAGSG